MGVLGGQVVSTDLLGMSGGGIYDLESPFYFGVKHPFYSYFQLTWNIAGKVHTRVAMLGTSIYSEASIYVNISLILLKCSKGAEKRGTKI